MEIGMKKALMLASVASMIEKFNMNNIEILENEGYIVDVAANFEFGLVSSKEHVDNFKQELLKSGKTVHELSIPRGISNISAIISAYKKVKLICDKNKYDIIHCHSPIGGVIARLAARKSRKNGTKVIYTAHGFHFFKGAPLKNWLIYFPIEWICSFVTDVLITINSEDYNFAKKHMHAKKVEYVPGVGIDTKKINSIEIDRDKKREELGIPKDNIAVLSVGEISHRKNHEAVINALAKLNNPKIHYYIVGTGILKEKLINLVAKLQLEEYVHFMGYRTDIYELCKACDIFCFPSLQEGLPVALMEAMSAGMPVVCSKIRGSVDLLDSKGGRMCLPKDVNSLAENIEVLANNEKLRWQMGKYNKKAVINFDIKNVQTFMQKIYERV
ncbi:MAG: glycosyltransferase family 4 protein [Clostridia bacterium]|nr:glycosyltransferase family 4 protein [Clostridia bacterium]